DEPDTGALLREARKRGVETRVLDLGENPGDAAAEAPEGPIGIAGGDGSLGPVAAVAIERDVPFVCIPVGRRNHFARDAGLPRDDLPAALAAFTGEERRIDVGRAGDRVFLNNVSLGIYADLVHRRRALTAALRAEPLEATLDGEPLPARIILVANNSYSLAL